MRAYFCGVPAMMIYNYCASMLRSTGDSTRPLFFLTVSGTANVALNLVMVIGFSQGALGVGVATAAVQWLSCAMVLIYMSRDNGLCHFSFRQLGIHWETLRRIVVIGLPAGIQSSMFAIGNVVMQSALNSFNNTALVSGNAIASNLGAYSRTFCDAMTAAANVYVGQNTGAKNHARIREGVRRTAITVTVASILTNALLNLCSAPIVALFAPGNAEIMHFARIKLLVSSSFYFFSHLADVYAGSTRGMGRSTLPMIVSVGGNCGVRILWIYTVFAWVHEPLVIFFAHGVSWFVTFVAQLVIYHRTVRRVGLRWEQEKNDAVAASA
jgi:Na+-driven multidrug efflux pump